MPDDQDKSTRHQMVSLDADLNYLGFGVGNHAWCVSSSHCITSFLAESLSHLIAQVVSWQLLSSRPCSHTFYFAMTWNSPMTALVLSLPGFSVLHGPTGRQKSCSRSECNHLLIHFVYKFIQSWKSQGFCYKVQLWAYGFVAGISTFFIQIPVLV